MLTYELFDCDTGNIIGTYETKYAALAELRRAIEAYGESYADDVMLGSRDEMGHPQAVAGGGELVKRALGAKSPA